MPSQGHCKLLTNGLLFLGIFHLLQGVPTMLQEALTEAVQEQQDGTKQVLDGLQPGGRGEVLNRLHRAMYQVGALAEKPAVHHQAAILAIIGGRFHRQSDTSHSTYVMLYMNRSNR